MKKTPSPKSSPVPPPDPGLIVWEEDIRFDSIPEGQPDTLGHDDDGNFYLIDQRVDNRDLEPVSIAKALHWFAKWTDYGDKRNRLFCEGDIRELARAAAKKLDDDMPRTIAAIRMLPLSQREQIAAGLRRRAQQILKAEPVL